MAPTPSESSQLVGLFNAGRFAEVEIQARLLIGRYPASGFVWKVLGSSLKLQGKDGLSAFQKAAELLPDDAQAHSNLGNALNELGRLDEAVASYRRALKINPEYAEAHYNLNLTLRDLEQRGDAVASDRRIPENNPDDAATHINLGNTLHGLGQFADAAASYRRALEIKPDDVEAHNNLGTALQNLGRVDEAIASYRRALVFKPDYVVAHNNLGAALQNLGQFDEAMASYRRAMEFKPDYVEAHNNLGNALKDLGQFDVAVASCQRTLEIKPDFAEAHANLAFSLLGMGRFSEGWQEHEYRWEGGTPKQPRPPSPLPQWIGQKPAPGNRLLVFAEQGLGDMLQFSRYLPLVSEFFSGGVSIYIDAPLLALFRLSFPTVDILDVLPADQNAWQWQCPLLSLPLALGTTLETIPNRIPYLIPDPERVAHWQTRIAALGLPAFTRKIGMVWKPGSGMNTAAQRALTLQTLAPLLNQPGCACFSLQKEPDSDKVQWATSGKLIDWADEFADFNETASLAMNMDLVISVDTSVAHLAGGLGLPTWLFNRHASEWRWMRGREDSPWYPTMRIFTQKKPGEWDEVVDRMLSNVP